jgi:hypothetical protein
MLMESRRLLFGAVILALIGGRNVHASTDPITGCTPCVWTGQQITPDGRTYHVELELRKADGKTVIRYLGSDGQWHGPFAVTVSDKAQELAFKDNALPPNYFTIVPLLMGGTSNSDTGAPRTSTLNQLKPNQTIPEISSCFGGAGVWAGDEITGSGSHSIEMKFVDADGKLTVTYQVAGKSPVGPHIVTVDQENRELRFDDPPPNANRWTLRCDADQFLAGGVEKLLTDVLSAPTATVKLRKVKILAPSAKAPPN